MITTLSSGGAESMLVKLIQKSSRNQQYQHCVVSLTDEGIYAKKLVEMGIPVFCLHLSKKNMNPIAFFKLKSFIDKFKPHVLQTWLYHADFLGMLIKIVVRYPILLWNIRCSDMDFSKYAVTTRILVWIMSKMSFLPSAVVVNSRAGISVHRSYGYHPKKWQLIPNGFDTNQFKADPQKRMLFRKTLQIPESSKVIGVVGRFDPMKDFETFFQAAAEFQQSGHDATYVLVGKGMERSNPIIMNFVHRYGLTSSIHLLGERRDMHNIYPGFDLLNLSSSFGEGFPNVLGEAMTSEVPCVSTEVGDAEIIMGDSENIIPIGNAKAMAKKWDDILLLSETQRNALGSKLRKRIETYYSIEIVTTAYEKLYTESLIPQG